MFGEKLKELRTKYGKTQEDIAKYLEVAPQTIYKYEKGINQPDLNTLSKLAEYFNVSTDYLLGRTNVPITINESLILNIGKLYPKILKSKKSITYP